MYERWFYDGRYILMKPENLNPDLGIVLDFGNFIHISLLTFVFVPIGSISFSNLKILTSYC